MSQLLTAKEDNGEARIFLNGHKIMILDGKDLLNYLLLNILNVHFSPVEVLIEQVKDIYSICKEYCVELKQSPRKVLLTQKQLRRWSNIKTREQFLFQYYNLILSTEGKGNLPGFGFTNRFGDKLKGNPEKDTYR